LNFTQRAGISTNLEREDVLTNIGLMTPEGVTNAGTLVLGQAGSKFLISATLTCALFQGTTKTKVLDQKVFDGTILSNYQNALLYLQSHLNTEYIIGAEREEKLELPVAVLRESLINALAHRDYRSTANVQVYIFSDRVEIVNPGGLVGGLTLKNLGKRSAPRNPLLFGILYRMELVEHIGSGLKRMREELQQNNLPEPVLDVDENWFSITFMRKVLGLQESTRKKLEPITQSREIDEPREKTREKILNLVQEQPKITTRELAAVIGISVKGVEWQIGKLKKENLLKRIGPDKGGYWEILK
jgi:ATP-dependent DNA helicase RecG